MNQALIAGVLAHERRALAKTITLLESTRVDHQVDAQQVLEALLPYTGSAIRVGISGVPGAGKSTFIEVLGLYLIARGHRVAVLAVDPSSTVSGGSILGDKTRMERLCQQENAFIRPSPTSGALGGVAQKTREAMLVCEASGYDVVIVETVGVGQSETAVADMVDMFTLLQLPNTGDDLQAIKKGIVELADIVLYNKVDIDPQAVDLACAQMQSALSLLRPASPSWQPPVLKVSAQTGAGIEFFWQEVMRYQTMMQSTGEFEQKRRRQARDWMWALIESGLRQRFRENAEVKRLLPEVMRAVELGEVTPNAAAVRLLRCGGLENTG